MQKDLVQEIISKKIPCIFVSPHFDDAILSCGGLLTQLSGKTAITVVNVFTKAHAGPYTLSARKFLMDAGYRDAVSLYNARCLEDKRALATLRATVSNLDFVDALFRRKKKVNILGKILPEIDHLYPTYQWHVVKGISAADTAPAQLQEALAVYKAKGLVFAPSGIGNHSDHQIVRRVCQDLFSQLIFYSDFPYNARLHSFITAKEEGKLFRLKPNFTEKNKLIRYYKTQLSSLFPNDKIPDYEEEYLVTKVR